MTLRIKTIVLTLIFNILILLLPFFTIYQQVKQSGSTVSMIRFLLVGIILIVISLIVTLLMTRNADAVSANSKYTDGASAEEQTHHLHSLAACSNTLQESMDSITVNSSSITENIQNISFIMDELGAAMQQTAASITALHSVAQDMDESFHSMQTSAQENSDYMEEISNKALNVRLQSLETKNEVMTTAESVKESMNKKIEESKAVHQIAQLTDEILKISAQTNLLALNASIEAAHAGESGRGFAVVASEITKLAANTSSTATQIQTISQLVIDRVNELADESENVIDFMNTKTTSGYDRLVETSNDYQNDSKIMFDMMQDFAGALTLLEENIKCIQDSLNAIAQTSENSTMEITTISQSTYDVLKTVTDTSDQIINSSEIVTKIKDSLNAIYPGYKPSANEADEVDIDSSFEDSFPEEENPTDIPAI